MARIGSARVRRFSLFSWFELGRINRCSKCNGLDRIRSGGIQAPWVGSGRVGSDRRCSKYHGSARLGSGGLQNLAGRAGSDQEEFEVARVGSDRFQEVFKYHGSECHGSRIGSGRIRRF